VPDLANAANVANEKSDFVFTRTFDAAREDVWNAFTQPEHLQHWWGTPGSKIEIARHELKPGGLFHYSMKFPDGRVMWARFIYREIAPPERLVWLNGFSDEHAGLTPNAWLPAFPLETINTLTLKEQDGKTLMTFHAVPYSATDEQTGVFASAIVGMNRGFGATFNLLEKYLAQRS
jgi:uncharacterized protein YndB with AHSA1/START domain